MSENRMAASSGNRSTGCKVISQAISGLVHIAEKAAGPRARGAVFRQITPRLAHQPNGPARRRLAQQRAQQQIVFQARRSCVLMVRSLGIEQPAVFEDGIAVGHAGNIVGHRAGAAGGPLRRLPARAAGRRVLVGHQARDH